MMIDYTKRRKLELMLELMEMDEMREQRINPNRDEWGRFAPKEDQEEMTSYESILDEYDDPHYQWKQTSERTWELEWGLTGLEKFLLGGIGILIVGYLLF